MQGLVIDHREFWCPLCRQLANTVLPILPDAVGCTDPDRLVPDTEPALVRHISDVLHAPYPKQVTSVLLPTSAVLTSFIMSKMSVKSEQLLSVFVVIHLTHFCDNLR